MKTKIKLLIISLFLTNIVQVFGQNTGFRKYPYILLKQNTVTIMWQLYSVQNCTFKYKKAADPSFINVAVNTPYNDKIYKYELSSLNFSIKYDYEVHLADGEYYSGSFISPPNATSQELSFYGYGDTRGGSSSSSHSQFHNAVCDEILEQINNDSPSQTLLIHSGDWNYEDGESFWDNQYFYQNDLNAIELRSKVGVVGCIGNHEYNGTNYRKYWPYNYPSNLFYYSYDYGPVHFCYVAQKYPNSQITQQQIDWVKGDLHNSSKPWKILVFHPPVYSINNDPNGYNTEKSFFDDICNNHSYYGVNLVINGHIHKYSDWLVNGVHHLTLGGGGAAKKSNPLPYVKDPDNPNIIRYLDDYDNHYHFAKIDIHNQYAKIKITYWNSDNNIWEIYDEFIVPHSFTINNGENITWEDHGVHYYADSVVVKTGGTLTIKGYVEFERDGKIIVEPGGKLILDNALLTCLGHYNDKEIQWQGIQVYGNPNASQYPDANGVYSQGMLVLKNGATIENAVNAVALQNSDEWGHSGGIVIANDAHFINNRRSVEFLSYQNTFPPTGENCDNISRFTNCDFVYDDAYDIPTSLRTHVTMWEVTGVKFNGCTFTDETTNAPGTAYGIYTVDAGYRVNDYCNAQIMPCPQDDIIPTSFVSLDTAIYSANVDNPLSYISVTNSKFENNGTGIFLRNSWASVIVSDTFELGAVEGCNNNVGTGIQLDNSKMFAIENNSFMPFSGVPPADLVGIRISNTNNAGDEIYNNNYNGLDVAIQAEGKNWLTYKETGLAYYCNDNQNNKADFYVHHIQGLQDDGIQKHQGSDTRVAGNTFSPGADDYSNFYNESNYEIIYHYDQNGQNEEPVKRVNVKVAIEQLTKVCPDHYGGGDIRLSSTDYQQRETDYNTATASYNNASSNYDNAADSTTRAYWAGKMSYYNTERVRAAYDIIRSDMADTIAHADKFKAWMEELDTYTTNEALVDYYMQQGDYTIALNKVDSLPYRFTFTAYDSIEYPMYHDFKHKQAGWLADGRNIFDLTASEISSLITIADSSKGTAGAQARAILLFAYPSQYSYVDCITLPGNNNKSAKITGETGSNVSSSDMVVVAKPNPANNTVTFSYTLPDKVETAILTLYSTDGKPLYSKELYKQASSLRYNCSHLKAGVYYYSVTAAGKTVSGKLIIVR